jgi:hypothetical protein
MVYSLILGMPIWKPDYFLPWSPADGGSFKVRKDLANHPPPLPAPGREPARGPAAAPALDPKFLQAMGAAWKTSMLCRTMLQVTKDEAYREYPTGCHLDIPYDSVINSLQPAKPPEIAPDMQDHLVDTQKLLYIEDSDGNMCNTSLYNRYLNNAQALATANRISPRVLR